MEAERCCDEAVVAELIAGAGIAFCFGAAMHYLDAALDFRRAAGAGLTWYWRALLLIQKRILMIGQLAAAALVVGVLGLLVFNEPIPSLWTWRSANAIHARLATAATYTSTNTTPPRKTGDRSANVC